VFDFSQKNKRGDLSVLEKKRGKLFRKHQQPQDSTTKKRIILHNTKAKKKTRKKENERRGSGNV
jgi:hypothetical protein